MQRLALILAALCGLTAHVVHATLAAEYQSPEVRLTAESVRFPLVLVKGYPFIEGRVGSTQGKFMLDTGAQHAMALNHHRIPLSGGAVAGTGSFGSGQIYTIMMRPDVSDVNVADLHLDHVTHVQSQDATQLEHIVPDFLGWFGYQAWADYAMKLDYRVPEVVFHKGGPDRLTAAEEVVAKVPYRTRLRPNIPIVMGSLGATDVLIDFDTGQRGAIFVDPPTRDRWIAEGRLIPRGEDTYDVKGLRISHDLTVDVTGLPLMVTPFPAAKATGITERISISLGYALLDQFVTVWDFPHKTLYFLKARP